MKNKFLILSLLVSSFFTACSSDDDGGDNIDPIIGTWQKTAEIEDGVEIELDECELQSTFTFTSNGELSSISYYEYEDECLFDTSSSNWDNQGNNVYGIGEEAIEDSIEFTFSNNNNTISYEYEFEGVVTEYIYTRVEE